MKSLALGLIAALLAGSAGAFPAYAPDANGTAVKVLPTAPVDVTPATGTTAAIVTGGTAVTVVTGPVNGGYIVNPSNTAAQGVTAENAYIDPVGTPGSTDSAANGTTSLLTPGQSYNIPPLKTGSVIKANAATSGHKLVVVTW